MLLQIAAISVGLFVGACFRVWHSPESCASVVGWTILSVCRFLTLSWQFWRRVFSAFAADRDRAPQRLKEGPRFLSVGANGQLIGLGKLPPVPPLPDLQTLAFAGCANLCMYMAGVAYAIQQAPNFEAQKGKLKVRGGSSGAFVAAPFASGCNMAEFMRLTHEKFAQNSRRLGGCIGLYSASIGSILGESLSQAKVPPLELKSLLELSVTRFAPWPEHVVVDEFRKQEELVDTVLASCYLPVAYEIPKRLRNLGFCVDGCALQFLPNAQCVVSPYHCHLPDVGPAAEYPRSLVFNLMHGDDVLRLFEDGYLDTIRWLERGGTSKLFERQQAASEDAASTWAFIGETARFVKEVFIPSGKRKAD